MAESSDANTVPEGTTLVFGSWACTTDGSGSFSSHLIIPKELEAELDDQPAGTNDAPKFGGNQVPPKINSENLGNMSTPTRIDESAKPNTIQNSENFQNFQTMGKYVAYLKSIKRPKIVNSELLDRVDRFS